MSDFFTNLSKGFIALDNSTFQNVQCHRLFALTAILKKKPVGGRSPLVFGGACHKILEGYYRNQWAVKNKGAAPLNMDSLISDVAAETRIELDSLCDTKRNSSSLKEFMYSYFTNTKISGEYLEPVTLPDGTPAVECSFSLYIGDIIWGGKLIKVLWEGRLDLIARDLRTGRVGIWDHKTCSMLGDSFSEQFQRGTQFPGYLFAANVLTDGEFGKLDDVGINALCMKKINEYKHFNFRRPEWDEQEVKQDIIYRLQSFMSLISEFATLDTISQEFGTIPGCRSACTHKYGKCTFFNLCEVAPHERTRALLHSGNFETNNWSPLNGD